MDNKQEYLKYLLDREHWTAEQKQWMLDYLNSGDLSELETVAARDFHEDVDAVRKTLEKRLSENILYRIHQDIGVAPATIPAAQKSRRRFWPVMAAAAVLMVIAGAAFFIFNESFTSGMDEPSLVLVATGAGERKHITLPDHSIVSLEPGSTLRYPESFDAGSRQVMLDGEAFFDVQHDEKHPFTIEANDIRTTVLGTSFNVEAFQGTSQKVVVVTGLVKVQPLNGGQSLPGVETPAGQSAEYDKGSGNINIEDAAREVKYYRQRQAGAFVYEGETVEMVLADLNRYFKTNVVVGDKAKNCRFFGTLYTRDDLAKSLKLVAISLNAELKQEAGHYAISGGGCR